MIPEISGAPKIGDVALNVKQTFFVLDLTQTFFVLRCKTNFPDPTVTYSAFEYFHTLSGILNRGIPVYGVSIPFHARSSSTQLRQVSNSQRWAVLLVVSLTFTDRSLFLWSLCEFYCEVSIQSLVGESIALQKNSINHPPSMFQMFGIYSHWGTVDDVKDVHTGNAPACTGSSRGGGGGGVASSRRQGFADRPCLPILRSV